MLSGVPCPGVTWGRFACHLLNLICQMQRPHATPIRAKQCHSIMILAAELHYQVLLSLYNCSLVQNRLNSEMKLS